MKKNNNINKIQNTEEVLSALFAQKYLYSKAKWYGVIKAILIILSCIITNFLNIVIGDKYVLICAIIIILGSCVVEKHKDELVAEAAEIREYADKKIFEIEVENNKIDKFYINELNKKIKSLNFKYKKKAKIQKESTGDSKEHGVKDWYVGISPSIYKNLAIYKCQIQNSEWDKSNNEVYKKIIGLFTVIIVVFVLYMFKMSWYSAILAVSEPIVRFGIIICKSRKYQELSIAIKTLEERIDIKNINIKDLLCIQNKIFERRRLGYEIPDFIHKLKSEELHNVYKEEDNG